MNIFDILVVQPIFNLLMTLYSVVPGGDFGIAVIIFTVIMRVLMWPLVVKQLHQVKAMRKLQPELAKIKTQAKGNKQMQGMLMLELYKKHNVNPFRSLGLLLIQLPIFIGLYRVIQIFTMHRDELAKYSYDMVEKLPAVAQLIQNPDNFNQHLFGIVDLTRHAVDKAGVSPFLLLLAVAAGVLQYISSKQTMPQNETKKGLRQIMAEAAEGKEADQAEMNAVVMQKMIKLMPVMLTLVMINLPGAIALYQCVFTIVAVWQQHILLKRDEDDLQHMAGSRVRKAKKPKVVAEPAPAVVAERPVKKAAVKKKTKTSKKAATKATVRVVTSTKKGGK